MTLTRFIFVRHGQSQANADGIIATATTPLTEAGVEQAKKTGKELLTLGVTTIVASPYVRAQQTAQTIADELGIPLEQIKTIEELRERGLGDQEGNPKAHESAWYSQSDDNPTLETREQLLGRMNTALDKIKGFDETGLVLAVGHAISGFYLVEAAKGARIVADMDGDNQIGNADFIEVRIK
jgi:broad specificity phosphatase PhoE